MHEFWLLNVTWFFGWSLRTSLGLRFVWYTSLRRLPSDIFWGRRLASDMNSLCLLFECCCSPCLAPNRSCWILGRVRVSLCSKPNETLFRRRLASTFISKIDQPIAFRSTVENFIFFGKQFLSPGFVKQEHLDGNSTRHMFKVYNMSQFSNSRRCLDQKRILPTLKWLYNWITMVWSALATRSIYLMTASLVVRFIVSKTRFINIRKPINR